ncbi:riboflavin synthase subunit alpha [Chlamydia vaughanii]|uniref:riboflavin synthase subunit alpha n=1 Tax=Chlamydia vaughanii TaxID=3112552 RepID=UPI0032B15D11
MFSGIVQELGEVASVQPRDEGLTLGIQCSSKCVSQLETGCSIAIDGVCLTAVSFDETGKIFFDVIPETLACTTIGDLTKGDRVNIERSLKASDEIGGHMVSGHVCGVGEIVRIEKNRYYFRVPNSLAIYLFEKGFVSVDGISLTIVTVDEDVFSIGLIPETLARTTLGFKREKSKVNIEPDMNTKTQVDTLRRLYPT